MTPELMRQRRAELGLSQGQVGMSQSAYNRIENGLQQPNDVQARTIHYTLGNWHVTVGTVVDAYILAEDEEYAKRTALELYAWAIDVSGPIKLTARKR